MFLQDLRPKRVQQHSYAAADISLELKCIVLNLATEPFNAFDLLFFCVLFESQLVLTVSLRHVMQFLSLGGFVQALHCGYCNCDDRTLAWFIQGESTEKFCFNEIWNIGRVHPINVAVSRQSESQVAIYWETARWRGKTLFSPWERWEGGSRIGLEIYWMFLQEWLIERVSSSAEA